MPRTLKIGIEREGRSVWFALATASGAGPRATLRTGTRAAASIAANMREAVAADEDFSSEFQIAGELETEPSP